MFFIRLHMVRLMLLERLLQHLSQLHNVGGVQAIPYMQVILMLTSDLDGEDEKDKGALDDLLAQLIAELGMHKKVTTVLSFPHFVSGSEYFCFTESCYISAGCFQEE